jgi:hypothetical protein
MVSPGNRELGTTERCTSEPPKRAGQERCGAKYPRLSRGARPGCADKRAGGLDGIGGSAVEANYRAQVTMPAGIDETRLLVVDEHGERATETTWRPSDNYRPGPRRGTGV